MNAQSQIDSLQAAVQLSPDNPVLCQLLAETLLSANRPAEAEQAYREALRLQPDDVPLKLGLARAFGQNGKTSAALVLLEELAQQDQPTAHLHLARLLLDQGQETDALHHYQRARQLDDTLYDEQLANIQQPADTPLLVNDVPSDSFALDAERPAIRFADVGGMDAVKDEIALKIIFPLTKPDLYKAYGKKTGGGILLYGPPGCGKTYLARATAGEINAAFISVGLNDVLDLYLGNSERKLHDLFQQARALAPSVLFFDEVDALGASRNDLRHSASRTLVNQFLDELDGVRYDNEGILVLAATNSPWFLDSAFRRPGRFDRLIFVGPPDAAAREAILTLYLRNVPNTGIDTAALAKRTEAYSGADLKAVIDRAVEGKLLQAFKSGQAVPLSTSDLLEVIKTQKPSVREWFASAKNYALYAHEASQYEGVLAYMKAQKWL
ncbi:putative cell division cycle ATPase [Fibrella aestuarina BUZ 2]|uniref:Putative cell division cycle ATPase n=1 Tax=Fibrella aestuarina BUZ 2 TaxID=1166018 RepID=I0KG83_9BACT|nr:ATP-binding protein [Fibrella aestuarina]CCH03136.1 putative cell division cycle ATPase [Fibrella aestuarina BUZ 2]